MVNPQIISCVICTKPVRPNRFDLLNNVSTSPQFQATQSATLRCFDFRQEPYVGATYISSFSEDSEIRSTGIYCTACSESNRELFHLLRELISVEDRIESVMKNVRGEFKNSLKSLQPDELEQLARSTAGNQKKLYQLRLELVNSPEISLSSLHGKLPSINQVNDTTEAPSQLVQPKVRERDTASNSIPDQDDANSFCGADDDTIEHFDDYYDAELQEPAQLPHVSPSPTQTTSAEATTTTSEALLLQKFGIKDSFVKLQSLSNSFLKSLGIKGRSYPCLFGDCAHSSRNFSLLDRKKHLLEVHHLTETDIVALDVVNRAEEESESEDEEFGSADTDREGKWSSKCIFDDCESWMMPKKTVYTHRTELLDHIRKKHHLTLSVPELDQVTEERRAKVHKRTYFLLKSRTHECWLADCPATEFQSSAEVEQHMEDAHPELPSTKARSSRCTVWACNLRFITVEDRDVHILQCHNGLKNHVLCPWKPCSFFLPSAQAVEVHLKENHRGKRHDCPFCGKGFYSSLYLDKHVSKKHFGKEYTCLYMECTESFDTINKRDFHIGDAHGNTMGFFRCITGCRRRFPTQEQLDQHKQARHKIRTKLPCPICDCKFISTFMLERHVNAHTPEDIEKAKNKKPKRQFKAMFRKFTDPSKREYTASGKLKRKRSKKKQWFYCDVCNEECLTENDLRQHKTKEHRKFTCDACGAEFKCHSGLDYHVKAFHDQKFHNICEVCGKSFLRPAQRDMHYRSVHLGERNFACDICGKTYSASSNLRFHKVKNHGLPTTKRGPMPRYNKRPQDYRYPVAVASAKRKPGADASATSTAGTSNRNTPSAPEIPSAPVTSNSSSHDPAVPRASESYVPNGLQYSHLHQGLQQQNCSTATVSQPSEINYSQLSYMMQQSGFPYNVPK